MYLRFESKIKSPKAHLNWYTMFVFSKTLFDGEVFMPKIKLFVLNLVQGISIFYFFNESVRYIYMARKVSIQRILY